MAHPKLLSSAEILKAALHLLEYGDADGLSLRAVALLLGVQAPSLYRYFPNKEALEIAVAEEILTIMLGEFRTAAATADPATTFFHLTDAYLRFARERFSLYAFVMQHHHPKRYGSRAGKAIWNLLLDSAASVSGQPDDTAAAVATWAFLHGYVTLEHAGAFGPSGPKGGWERGIEAFLTSLGSRPHSARKARLARTTAARKKTKPNDAR